MYIRKCVFGCSGARLHKFPSIKYQERFNQWKEFVGSLLHGKTDDDIRMNHRICENHFESFYCLPSHRLTANAVPTISFIVDEPQHSSEEQSQQLPQMPSTSSIGTSTISYPDQEMVQLNCNQQLNSLKEKIARLKDRYKKLSDKKPIRTVEKLSKKNAFLKVTSDMSTCAKVFAGMQLKHNKKTRARKFTEQEKILSLMIAKQSQKAYNFLKKLFTLPSKRTLSRLLKKVKFETGINDAIFMNLKKVLAKIPLEERICSLMFDEMALSPNIQYNKYLDNITGFEDFGNGTNKKIADHVLVFMVKGLKSKYKQPISYYFCQGSTNGLMLKALIKENITKLQKAGMKVVATVCDQAQANSKAINSLLLDTRAELHRSSHEANVNYFSINGEKVFPLYDPPHLIKCIRNNFLTKNLHYIMNNERKMAKWEHLNLLLEADPGNDEVRLCNKLTHSHVDPQKIPKMKVKYATQLFSQRVSSSMRYLANHGIILKECLDTAEVLLIFDKLFDSFNGHSYTPTKKPYKSALTSNSPHHTLWNEMLPILESMSFVVNKNGSSSLKKVPSINNWIHNIKTVKEMFVYLNKEHNVSNLIMRNLNQDPLENFFGNIRSNGVRNINPTCQNFESTFKTLLLNNLTSNHSLNANCEPDNNRPLQNLEEFLIQEKPPVFCEESSNINLDPIMNYYWQQDNDSNDLCFMESKRYVAGYVLRKCRQKISKSCFNCKRDLISTTPPHEHDFVYTCDYTGKSLNYPSQPLFDCLNQIHKITVAVLKCTRNYKSRIKKTCETFIDLEVNFDFITCMKHKNDLISMCKNTAIDLIIHSWCTGINRILNGKVIKFDESDSVKCEAYKYYRTHKLKRRL